MPKMISSVSVFLASPSDVELERDVVAAAIQRWNATNGQYRKVMFDLQRWETNVSAGFGIDGQDVINQQIGDDYDVLIALFWAKFGSQTARARSGTVEEYERALERYRRGDPVEIAVFFKDAPVDFRSVDLDNLQLLKNFEKEVQSAGALSKSFTDNDGLQFELELLLDRLARQITDHDGQIRSMRAKSARSIVKVDKTIDVDEDGDDELGLFDVLERIESSTAIASSFLDELTDHLHRLTEATAGSGEKISAITSVRQITPSEARPIINTVANEMNGFSDFLEERGAGFDEEVTIIMNAIRAMIDISYDFKENPDAEENLEGFQSMVQQLYLGLQGSGNGMSGLLINTSGLQRMTSEFNKAKKRLVRNLESYIKSNKGHSAILAQAMQELTMLLVEVRSFSGSSISSSDHIDNV